MKKGPLGASWKLLALNDVEAFKPHHQPGPALCCRPEVCGEAEELAEGGKALHKLEPRVVEDVFNFPAARAEQADGGAEVGFRRGDFHKHKRLQRRDLCGFKGGAQGDARSHMVARDRGAVTPGHGGDFDVRILKGVTGNGIGLERVFHALPDSIDEGGGQDGRIDGEPDLVARTAFTRGDGQGDLSLIHI